MNVFLSCIHDFSVYKFPHCQAKLTMSFIPKIGAIIGMPASQTALGLKMAASNDQMDIP